MSFESVPCPACGNSRTPGQLDQPIEGWELPFMSIPCGMCHGKGSIPREVWDRLQAGNRKKPKPKKETKKRAADAYKKQQSMWDEMQGIKRQQDEDWMSQPNFKFRKVD